MGEKVSIETVVVTPQMAVDFLRKNKANRPMSQPWIKELARRIDVGIFDLSNDSICFDEDGFLINGQHRLSACVRAGKPIPVSVMKGMNKNAFQILDEGKKRNAADLAALKGMKNASRVGAALMYLINYDDKTMTYRRIISNAEKNEKLKNNELLEQSVSFCYPFRDVASVGVLGACHYIFSRIDRKDADEFMNAVGRGIMLYDGHPALLFRKRMTHEKGSKGKLPGVEIFALIVKAWNFYRKGQKIKTLRWSKGQGEVFPEAI